MYPSAQLTGLTVFSELITSCRQWLASRPGCSYPREKAADIHSIRNWESLGAGRDEMEKRKLSTILGLERRPHGCPARSSSYIDCATTECFPADWYKETVRAAVDVRTGDWYTLLLFASFTLCPLLLLSCFTCQWLILCSLHTGSRQAVATLYDAFCLVAGLIEETWSATWMFLFVWSSLNFRGHGLFAWHCLCSSQSACDLRIG
jgi:hypothetical protein